MTTTDSIFVADAKMLSRFWSKVSKNGPLKPNMTSECWVWTASTFDDGYGKFWLDGRNHPAQRVAWLLATGRLPERYALHHCDEPGCVRFDHLFDGDAGDNARDRESKGRSQSIIGDLNPSRRHPDRLPRGEAHPFAKLTEAEVSNIRQRASSGAVQRRLAEEFQVSPSTINEIVKGKRWVP